MSRIDEIVKLLKEAKEPLLHIDYYLGKLEQLRPYIELAELMVQKSILHNSLRSDVEATNTRIIAIINQIKEQPK